MSRLQCCESIGGDYFKDFVSIWTCLEKSGDLSTSHLCSFVCFVCITVSSWPGLFSFDSHEYKTNLGIVSLCHNADEFLTPIFGLLVRSSAAPGAADVLDDALDVEVAGGLSK